MVKKCDVLLNRPMVAIHRQYHMTFWYHYRVASFEDHGGTGRLFHLILFEIETNPYRIVGMSATPAIKAVIYHHFKVFMLNYFNEPVPISEIKIEYGKK